METEITELEELGAEKVSGVGTPANGTPWLFFKAAEENDSPEMEDELTKTIENGALALSLLDDYARKGTCSAEELEGVQKFVDALEPEVLAKARLKAKQRNALPDSDFAYIDSKGGRHLPIQDEGHVRSAMGRIAEQHFESPKDKVKAQAKIDAKAKSFGMTVSKSPGVPDVSVKKPKIKGKIKTGAQSGLAGNMTDGLKPEPDDPSFAEGGRTPYHIPTEARINTNPPTPAHRRSKREDAAKESWSIEVVSKEEGTNWLSMDNPSRPKSDESAATEAAKDHLPAGDEQQENANKGTKPSEEDEIMTTVTKEELAELVAKTSKDAVTKAMKAERKVARKAASKQAKKAKKALKNANNGGDITAEQEESEVRGHVKADDLKSIGGKVQRQFINKSAKKEAQALEALTATVAQMSEKVAKMAARPRSGGPVLDGQARGSFVAAEGRHSDGMAKGAEALEIERLEKSFGEAQDPMLKMQLGEQLTLERLRQGHREGRI